MVHDIAVYDGLAVVTLAKYLQVSTEPAGKAAIVYHQQAHSYVNQITLLIKCNDGHCGQGRSVTCNSKGPSTPYNLVQSPENLNRKLTIS